MRLTVPGSPRSSLLGLIAAVAALSLSGPVAADCNLFPGTSKAFNAELGASNRPFAAPGESVEIATRDCDTGSISQGLPLTADNYVVTVVFQPASGPRRVVALTTDANCITALGSRLTDCQNVPGVAGATCVGTPQSGLSIVTRDGVRYLSFQFPDTDQFVGNPSDDFTLSGPAAVAVTEAGDALPCDLVSTTCLDQSGL